MAVTTSFHTDHAAATQRLPSIYAQPVPDLTFILVCDQF